LRRTGVARTALHVEWETYTNDQVTRTFDGFGTRCECSASRPRGTNAHLHGQRLHEACAPVACADMLFEALLEFVNALCMLTIARMSVFRSHDRDQIS
jgi:hypothetical protein